MMTEIFVVGLLHQPQVSEIENPVPLLADEASVRFRPMQEAYHARVSQ